MGNVPNSKPQISREKFFEKLAAAHPGYVPPAFFTAGIRGYYEDTMGKPGENDRNIYDDAMFVVGKEEFYTFNANCDPSYFRKWIANLKPGIYDVYKFDLHNGKYLALCQRAGKVTVIRDQVGEDTGMFGINQHRGGFNTTSSLGCQTVYPTQWEGPEGFITRALECAEKYYGKDFKKKVYTYILLEE